MLDAREEMVLRALKRLPKDNIVLIGGYAVNAYVPPRFSIDCDLVVLGSPKNIESLLKRDGFKKVDDSHGGYVRYAVERYNVSFDLLTDLVVDRDTKIAFEGELFKKYSAQRTTVGRVVPTRITMRIADPELLFAMKFVSARKQDIRDLFMLAGENLDWKLVGALISNKCGGELTKERVESITTSVNSKHYRDSLQGPYGKIPDTRFDKCKKNLTEFLKRIG